MSFLVQRSDVGEFRHRYQWMVLGVLAAFLTIVARLFELQALDDVGAGDVVGGRGQRDARDVGEALVQQAQRQIFAAEVVAPLAHAMRLVDRKEGNAGFLKSCQQRLHNQSFGSNVDKLELAICQITCNGTFLFQRQRTVQKCSRNSASPQGINLILHQRNQGRNDDSYAVAAHRRHLITQGFSPSGRQNHNRILVLHDQIHRFQLKRSKILKPPMSLKCGSELRFVGERAGRIHCVLLKVDSTRALQSSGL